MLPFRTNRGARFRCQADFTAGTVLNLNFFDESRQAIPFHLSVRRDEALVVVNRFDRAGWRREIRYPMRFGRGPVPVDVLFGIGRVSVSVAGRLLGTFDAFPRIDPKGRFHLRRGFPRLDRIAFVDALGDVVPNSLLVDRAQRDDRVVEEVHINDALEVMRRGLDATAPATGTLAVAGFDEVLPAVLRALPYLLPGGAREHAMVAVLPGRLWAGGAQRLDMVLTDETGQRMGAVSLDRGELVRRIELLARSGGFDGDDRVAVQAIEHVRHAGLAPDLDGGAYRLLAHAAGRFGLGEFLAKGAGAPQATAPLAAPEDPRILAERAVVRFTAAMREDPGQDPFALFDAELATLSIPVDRSSFFARLMEWFALADRLDAFLLHRRKVGVAPPEPPGETDHFWRALLLPLDYAEGKFGEIAGTLWALAAPGKAWLPTPVIGWVLERAAMAAPDLDGGLPIDWQRTGILDAGFGLLQGRAEAYWDRTSCRRLIRAMVVILRHADALPSEARNKAIWTALQVYGLNPGFWDMLRAEEERGGWQVPRQLLPAMEAFGRIRAVIEEPGRAWPSDDPDLSRDLDLFRQIGCHGLTAFRRDLFGPRGVPHSEAGKPFAPLLAGLDPDEAALRDFAFPGSGDMPHEGELEAIRDGLAAAFAAVPQNPFSQTLRLTLADATRILQGPDPVAMDRFLQAVRSMESEYSRFMGIALPLSLARGLLDRGRAEECGPLFATVAAVHEALDADPKAVDGLRLAPAPRLALDALLRDHGAQPAVAALAARLEPGLAPGLPAPAEDRTADLAAAAHPLQDTLLCLYTCQPYLGTRVKAIRETWLPLLAEIGVPYLIFVGNGDGRREGDIVYLDAPDDYEGLPQKTLALVRWVLTHTSFAHLVKVDDDCFVDPRAWFGDLAHRSVNYYGRALRRKRGEMDRTWHQAKSRSDRGRLDLDKSPEPSTYADGGSGYALSRIAMQAIVAAVGQPAGRELIHLSFMEDKLVGDLLSTAGIGVDNTDYRICLLRRTRPGGPLVALWDNGFLPFRDSGIRLAHLDGDEKMAEVLRGMDRPLPSQSKVWPSFQPVRQGWASNTLDLISSTEKLARANAASVAVVACLRNEMFILPRFLEHYRKLGVQGFLVVDNGSDDGSFEYLADQPDVALFSVDTPYSESVYGVAWQQALLSNFRVNRWSLVADLDEFLFWNTDLNGNLPALLESPDFAGADAARIFMLDMYPGGSLSEADFQTEGPFAQAGFVDREPFLGVSGSRGPYSDAPVWTSALRHRLIEGSRADLFVAQKIALLKYRPWMRLSAGLHFVADVQLARRDLVFAHFKYNAAFRAKALAEVARRQHFNNAEEYRKYLAVVSEGRDVIHDPAISVRWDQSPFVRRLCGSE